LKNKQQQKDLVGGNAVGRASFYADNTMQLNPIIDRAKITELREQYLHFLVNRYE